MPGSNYSYSTGEFLNKNQKPQYFDSPEFEVINDDENQEFHALLSQLQKIKGKQLGEKQVNGLMAQWNSNKNGYRDQFRNMIQSKMGLQNTVNPQEIASNVVRLKTDKVFEGMTNVSKAQLQSTINKRNPIISPIVERKPVIPAPKAFNDRHWLGIAKQYGFNSIDEVKAWQKQNGLVNDGKFGQASLAKWNELNSAPQPIEKAQKERANGRLTVDIPEEIYTRTTKNLPSNNQEKSSEVPTSVVATINRTAARFPGGGGGYSANGNKNGKAFFGLADSDALVNLAGDAWNATKGFMSRLGNYLAGPDKPIQTNTPSYGRRNLITEGMQKVHNTFGNAYH